MIDDSQSQVLMLHWEKIGTKKKPKKRDMKNASQLQMAGITSSKLINYFTNVNINVSMKVKQRQGREMLIAHG